MRSIFIGVVLLLFSATAFAGPKVTVDLTTLPANVQTQILDQQAKAEQQITSLDQEAIEKYATVGKMLAVAMKEFCQTIGVEVNEFIKTPAGKIVTILLVWKYIGADITTLVFGTLGFFGIILALSISFKIFILPKKMIDVVEKMDSNGKVVSREKNVRYEKRFKFFNSDDDDGSMKFWCGLAHIFLAFVVMVFWFINVLP